MTAPDPRIEGVAGRLADLAGVLGRALDQWAARDDTQAQPEVRQAANVAMESLDGMLAEVYRARAALVAETRARDDAHAARVDAMLAKFRAEREGGSNAG